MTRGAERFGVLALVVSIAACGGDGGAATGGPSDQGPDGATDVGGADDIADDTPLDRGGADGVGDSTPDGRDRDVTAEAGSDTTSEDTGATGPVEITDALLTRRSGNCADYVAEYASSVLDIQRDMAFTGSVIVTLAETVCRFDTVSIPNHDFNDERAHFATPVSAVAATYEVPRNPMAAASPTSLSLMVDNAIFLNGVKLDLLAAACYGVGAEPLGRERIGCMAMGTPWRYDPMTNDFGTDSHHAHTQPDGTYHYHGDPRAMFDDADPERPSPVIGFAADGFPIFGPYFDDGATIRRARSGYTLRSGSRVSQAGEGAFPGGTYDGTFIDDWEWTGAGDLDACNGMTVDGVYGYYVTDSYPWVMGCFTGAPHPSFRKAGGGPPR